MKKLLLTMTLLLSFTKIYAQEFSMPIGGSEEVLEVIFEQTQNLNVLIDADSFVPNIMGYACPVPALNLHKDALWSLSLRHRGPYGFASFGVKGVGLSIANPEMRFCEWPTATDVFGEEFVVGAKLDLSVTVKREIIQMTMHDGAIRKVLKESITSELNGHKLSSEAKVFID